jgi:hypothetical protein
MYDVVVWLLVYVIRPGSINTKVIAWPGSTEMKNSCVSCGLGSMGATRVLFLT